MGQVRVADYIVDRISQLGVKDIFTLTGGGAMFLNDAVGKHPNIRAVFNHHEQACAMAAVGYAKYNNDFAVVMPTTGCGCTNTITGLLEAWQDNVKCLFISGQVNKSQTTYNCDLPLRQIGVQEANVIEMVKSITKYSVMINDPEQIAYHLDKAIYLAESGRPGPVWLDIPLDVQGAYIDPLEVRRFEPEEENTFKETPLKEEYEILEDYFNEAKRPVLLVGNGVRMASAINELKHFVEKFNIPTVTTFLGIDLLPSHHPLNIGRIGIKGNRAANFAVQNSDLLLTVGTRLGVPVVGYKYELFAREAKIVVVDIDPEEHKKDTIKIDYFINADAKLFLEGCNFEKQFDQTWANTCLGWKNKWRICQPDWEEDREGINLYYFTDKLSKNNKRDSVVVSDAGSSYYVTSQFLDISHEQRHITSGAQADMGFTIPAAIGVSVAKNNGDVIGITGDGSFQTNIQELQTIVQYQLPIKLFVWNNHGYLSIRTTQKKFFKNDFVGVDNESGISFPNTEKIANAYGIKYFNIKKSKDIDKILKEVIDYSGPVICEVMCQKWQEIVPTLVSTKTKDGRVVSRPFEDMYPILSREEFYENMIVKPIEYD